MIAETWLELHHSAIVVITWRPRRGRGYWLSWSPRIAHGPYPSKMRALLAASHALGLRGVDCDWRRDVGPGRVFHARRDPAPVPESAECSVWDIPQGDNRYARLDRGGARAHAPAALIRAQMAAGMAIEWGALPLVVLAAHRRR